MDHVEKTPVVARPAATVVIARDNAGELEILLAKRAQSMRFMAGAHVFPGGAVHASDAAEQLLTVTKHTALPWPATDATGVTSDAAHVWAAVRETLEEVGLLLACDGVTEATLQQLRTRVREGGSLAEGLLAAQLQLDLSRLIALIRWITPASEPMRFDTRFYVVAAPSDQTPEADGCETSAAAWWTPRAALAATEDGAMILPPPTLSTLRLLAGFDSVTQVLAHATSQPVVTVEPVIHTTPEGERVIVYPEAFQKQLLFKSHSASRNSPTEPPKTTS